MGQAGIAADQDIPCMERSQCTGLQWLHLQSELRWMGTVSHNGTSGPEPPIVLYSQDVFDSIRTAIRNCV